MMIEERMPLGESCGEGEECLSFNPEKYSPENLQPSWIAVCFVSGEQDYFRAFSGYGFTQWILITHAYRVLKGTASYGLGRGAGITDLTTVSLPRNNLSVKTLICHRPDYPFCTGSVYSVQYAGGQAYSSLSGAPFSVAQLTRRWKYDACSTIARRRTL